MTLKELKALIQELESLEFQRKAKFEIDFKKEEIADVVVDELEVSFKIVGQEYKIIITQMDTKDPLEKFKSFGA